MPARLQRAQFTERMANPSLAAAVQSAATVFTKLVSTGSVMLCKIFGNTSRLKVLNQRCREVARW